MSTAGPPGSIGEGLFGSLRRLAATVAAMAHTRAELLGAELEEEVNRIVGVMVGAVACLALAALTLLFGGLLLVAMFWETHRIAALAGVAAGFLVLAAVTLVIVRLRWGRRAPVLSATLVELERDWKVLSGDSR